MKKAIVFIVIAICLLLIATTKMLIDLKLAQNESAKPTSTSAPTATPAPTTAEPIVETTEPIEEAKDENKKEEHKRIVLGKSTYKKNPLIVKTYNPNGEEKKLEAWESGYSQISGLKDKNLENEINNYLKSNNRVIHDCGFSNVFSKNRFNIINLVDGAEVTIDDYFYDREDIKIVLNKYIVKGLYEAFNMSESIYESSHESYFSQKYFDDVKLFNSRLEKWTQAIVRKYNKNDFRFYFDDSFLYLYFENLDFINPIAIDVDEENSDYSTPRGGIDSLGVTIPIYDIYPYVSIFDKFANAEGLYESENDVESVVGFEGFVKIKDNLIYKEYDVNDSYINQLIENNTIISEDWEQRYEKLLKMNDKEIVAIHDYAFDGLKGGYCILDFYVAIDKAAPEHEKIEIYKAIAEANSDEYYRKVPNLEEKVELIKNKYKDVDIYINKISTWENN